MARTLITVVKMPEYNLATDDITNNIIATANADGAEFIMNERDDKFIIWLENSTATMQNVVFKAGNGLQGVADLSIALPANVKKIISIESGRFKNVTGINKGKVIIACDAAVKIGVFCQP